MNFFLSELQIHKVEKCLQRLLRALHKDRHHTLAHYRHLLNMNFDEAERQREVTFERLMEVDRTVNQSLDMLNKLVQSNSTFFIYAF